MTLTGVDPAMVASRLAAEDIRLPAAGPTGVLTLAVNETWNRTTAPDLLRAFAKALG
jgi:hypothetical protein